MNTSLSFRVDYLHFWPYSLFMFGVADSRKTSA